MLIEAISTKILKMAKMIPGVVCVLNKAQSLIGKTQSEIVTDNVVGARDVRVLGGRHTKNADERDLEGFFLQFKSDNSSFLCDFPAQGKECQWVTVFLGSNDIAEGFRYYCSICYDLVEDLESGWYNEDLGVFITVFYDQIHKGYALGVIKVVPEIYELASELEAYRLKIISSDKKIDNP